MKTSKKLWIITAAAAAILLVTIVCVQWIIQLQRPLCIKLLGDSSIRYVEAGCLSRQGWQRERLDRDEMMQLVRLMNGIQGEPVSPPPRMPGSETRMVFSVEKADGKRSCMVLTDRTLTIDNDTSYLLSRKDARQMERLFGEIL